MSGVTCCMRFPGQLNSDIRKTMVNLVPFPRLHFFMVNYSPLTSKASLAYRPQTVPQMVSEMFDQKVTLNTAKYHAGAHMAAAALFRGQVSTKEVE